jgi:predicted ATP-grasp superfamily ATP-dependent carboligase
VAGTALVPDPLLSGASFAGRVADLVKAWRIDLVLPVTEASLLALLPERERIPARMPFPQFDSFLRLCDKGEVAAEAAKLGIKVPRTISLASPGDLVVETVQFPLVLKPHRSVSASNGVYSKSVVLHIQDEEDLKTELQALPSSAFPVLLQEHIEGPGVGVFVLLHKGALIAAFAHRRIREKPPSGGVSVYRESIALDDDLLARSVALLRRFEVEGAAMVEYKVSNRTAAPFIMEINGRLWGSLQLAIDAGVDFPALLVQSALEGRAHEQMNYRVGTRSRWFWGDVDNLILQFRMSKGTRGSTLVRLRAVLDFMRAWGPGNHGEVFRLSDPKPAIRETIDWFASLRGRS